MGTDLRRRRWATTLLNLAMALPLTGCQTLAGADFRMTYEGMEISIMTGSNRENALN